MKATEFRQLFRRFVQEETQQGDASLQARLHEAERMMDDLSDDQVETFAGILQEAFREQPRQDDATRGDPC